MNLFENCFIYLNLNVKVENNMFNYGKLKQH